MVVGWTVFSGNPLSISGWPWKASWCVVCCARFRRSKKIATRAMMPIRAMPPTTPPTIMPVFDLDEVNTGTTVGGCVGGNVVVIVGPDKVEVVEVPLDATRILA